MALHGGGQSGNLGRLLMLRSLEGRSRNFGGSGSGPIVSTCSDCPETNVLAFGADPTGVNDSTLAFSLAIAFTPVSGTIYCPVFITSGGTFVGTYSLNPDVLTWGARRWRGDFLSAGVCTTFRARSAGTALFATNTSGEVENIVLDANNLAQRGVNLVPGSGMRFNNVRILNATQRGASLGEGVVFMRRVTIENCAVGAYLLAPNGSNFYDVSVLNCASGVEHYGIGSGLSAQSGDMAWYGGIISGNGGAQQILFDGIEGSHYTGLTIDGATDGIRVINNAHNFVLSQLMLTGPETNVAFRFDDGFSQTLVGCTAEGTNYGRVRMASAQSSHVDMYGCTGEGQEPMPIFFDNGGGTVETYRVKMNVFHGLAAPTIGTWRNGDVIINAAVGAPTGWRCTVAGAPGTWVAF